jgi:3-oxoacyl-[acyl-carrier-protein] synthase-1
MRVTHEIEITTSSVLFDGQPIAVENTGDKLLVELYRRYAGDYPKFFKMDTLSRLGFMAAEILLQKEKVEAVVFANRSASIKNDTDYLATIAEGNYYPSPSLFVYTLPNIVTGEIAIRHQLQGETAFYILESPEQLEPIVQSQITCCPTPILAGWVECSAPNMFYAKLQIIWNN